MLQALTETFTREGFTVLEARNGQEGLVVALREHPDLILTNLSDAAKAAEALQHNAFDFLVKSDWKLEDVVQKIRERLGIV